MAGARYFGVCGVKSSNLIIIYSLIQTEVTRSILRVQLKVSNGEVIARRIRERYAYFTQDDDDNDNDDDDGK
ncbi:hypothetical protein SUGI_0816030 [Cryptomeria japonica]|nr:hypothetical protein SUGI_0816030 [Cryptomeria japonica]